MTDLYIIAAGRGSRMGGNVPKALVPITNEPNLTTTLKQIGHKFQNVFVVTNDSIQDQWQDYFMHLDPQLKSNLHNVPISSGLGDGHAVLWAFAGVRHRFKDLIESNDVVICWGDVFIQHAEIVDELLSRECYSGLVPAVQEQNPYVTLLTDSHMAIMSADFSKYGESHPSGFHDQSIFRFNKGRLWEALSTISAAFWKNGRYITQGGELSLLYAFHFLYNSDMPATAYETDYPTLGFNTPEEVINIQREINSKWQSAQYS